MGLNNWMIILGQAAPAATQPNQTGSMLQSLGFMLFLFAVMYILLIRPQQKKARELNELLKTVKPGDKVVTSSGIVGTVVSVKDRTIALRSAETKLEVLKSAVSEITERSSSESSESKS